MKRSAGASVSAQKNVDEEIDRRVAQRTAELTATIEQLRTELDERQRVAEAQREGELFNLIVESIPLPVAVTSPTGEVEAVNQPTLEYFGRTFEELKGWKSSDVVHPDDLERTVAAQIEAHQKGTAYNIESRHRRADGIYRWFNVLGLPLRDAQGHILRWFILQIDIDDRKRAEEALQAAERNLNLTINTIPTFIQVSRPDGSVLSVNQTVLDYYGVTLEDMQKEDFRTRVYHPEDVKRLHEWRKEALKRPVQFEYEQRALSKDGKYRWFLVRYNPLLDDQGRIERWFATAFDIEDRKRAEAALRSSELNLRQITNAIPTNIHVLRPDGSVLYVNQPVLDYTGLTMEETLRDDYRARVFHPEDLERIRGERSDALTRPVLYENEQRALGSDGNFRWFLARYNPLLNEEGGIDRWYVASLDIEDRKRAEAQLAGEKHLLEMVASGHALTDVLSELCRFVENTGGECKCGIYLINRRTATFHLGAAPSLPATFNDPVAGLTVSSDAGPCGLAALTKSQVLVTDIDVDPRFQGATIRPLLLAHGLRSHWSTPIYSRDGQVLGTFAIFQDRPSSPTQLQLDLIDQVTHIASIAIERALSEEALKRSEAELKLIVDTIPAMAWSARPDGSGEFFNQHYLDYVGLSAEQVRDWSWTASLHPDDREALLLTWQRILASGESGEGEVRLRRHDGEYRWFLFRANPVRDDSGRLVKWYGITIDISERKAASEQLQSNQDLLDLAQKSARATAFDWYVQHEVNNWSPEQEALYGLAPGAFDGTFKSWKGMIHPPDWPNVVAAVKHAEETGEVASEFRVVWPDGSMHWLSTVGRMFFDEAGKPFRMVGFTSDITRRKSIEEELRRSEAFLAQAQQLSKTGSFSWRVATDEITWSDELYRIYELDPDIKITLEVIRTRVHPEDLTLYEKMVEQARNGSDDFEWQYRLLMPDQSIKYMHAVARATQDPRGQLEYIAAVRDVTARRLSDEALDKARSELAHVARVMSLGALTASIAHEVNQPLSGIITNASTCVRMLDAEPPNVDGARETARRTIRDGRRASDVITRLRALFTHKEAASELVDLNEATEEVIALSRTELDRSGVVTRTNLSERLPLVMGDRVQLQQVILNLLRNGSDAMNSVDDRPRELMFSTAVKEGNQVRLSVQDSGVGFESQSLEQLFQTFYTTKDDGMGIGLSVSRSIIENHGGHLWATANDGPGVTFSFSIPCVDAAGDSRSKNRRAVNEE